MIWNRSLSNLCILITFLLSVLSNHVDCFYTQRQRYVSRMLKITPKECHSPEFPNVTGICMISLECQQRSGTVIGACRDGHLFGACCHDPLAAQKPTPLPSSTTTTTTTTPPIVTDSLPSSPSAEMILSKMPVGSEQDGADSSIPSLLDTFSELSPTFLSELALDEHTTGMYSPGLVPEEDDHELSSADDSKKGEEVAVTEVPVVISSSTEQLHNNPIIMEDEINGLGTAFKEDMIKYIDEIVTMRNEITPMPAVSPKEIAESEQDMPFSTFTIVSSPKYSEESMKPVSWSWSTSSPSSSTQPPPVDDDIKKDNVDNNAVDDDNRAPKSEEIVSVSVTQSVASLPSSTESNEVGTSYTTTSGVGEGSSTEAVQPTKFTFSKLKYTPRPFKPRHTTEKVVWTRPTTTATSYWKKPLSVSEEEEEEEEEEEKLPEAQALTSSTTIKTSEATSSTEQVTENQQDTASRELSSTEPSSTEPSSTEPSTSAAVSSSTEGANTNYYFTSPSVDNVADDDNNNEDHDIIITSTDGYPQTSPSPYSPSSYYPSYSTEKYFWSSPTGMSYLKGSTDAIESALMEKGYYNDHNGSRSDLLDVTMNEVGTSPHTSPSTYYSTGPTSSIKPFYKDQSTARIPTTGASGSSWESSIDSFVDQVVDGIVQDLNKNKIDEIIFKSQQFAAEEEKRKKMSASSSGPTVLTPTSTFGTTASSNPSTRRTFATTTTTSTERIKHASPTVLTPVSTMKATRRSRTTTTGTTAAPKQKSSSSSKEKGKVRKGGSSKPSVRPKPKGKIKVKPVKKVTTIKTTNSTRKRLDYKKDCGVRPLIKSGRIVGGTPSKFGSWPWHALVKETVWWGIFSKIKCGGVLIGAQHVLTAAHCQPQQTGTLSVVLGITDSDDADSRAITKTVRRVIPHPQFNPRTYENDIAILELESPIDFQPHIVPICLPKDDDELEGKTAYVTGMGLLKHDGERPLVLQEVDLPILNNTECQKMFVRSGNKKPIIESFICAGYEQGRKDSCGGDSGGPLSVKRNNGQWVLAGTVSHGIKCAVPDQPGVYMRTSYYKPWIDRVLTMSRSRYRGMHKCNAPPLICARQRHFQQQRQQQNAQHENSIVNTLFKFFRLARKMVDESRRRSLEETGN